jgi:hypothetical protein
LFRELLPCLKLVSQLGQAAAAKAPRSIRFLFSLPGFVAHNKIRVLQRRAYGYRDENYLKLKIVAAFPPPLTRSAEKDPH